MEKIILKDRYRVEGILKRTQSYRIFLAWDLDQGLHCLVRAWKPGFEQASDQALSSLGQGLGELLDRFEEGPYQVQVYRYRPKQEAKRRRRSFWDREGDKKKKRRKFFRKGKDFQLERPVRKKRLIRLASLGLACLLAFFMIRAQEKRRSKDNPPAKAPAKTQVNQASQLLSQGDEILSEGGSLAERVDRAGSYYQEAKKVGTGEDKEKALRMLAWMDYYAPYLDPSQEEKEGEDLLADLKIKLSEAESWPAGERVFLSLTTARLLLDKEKTLAQAGLLEEGASLVYKAYALLDDLAKEDWPKGLDREKALLETAYIGQALEEGVE